MPTQFDRPGSSHLGEANRIAPTGWLEWIWSVYDPDLYIVQWQLYGCTVAVVANKNGNTNNIQVPVRYFCFGFFSSGVIAATGAVPTFPYRIGLANGTGNNWTNGQWMSSVVTGDRSANSQVYREWQAPRELGINETVVVTVDNTVNAASEALAVDCTLQGYEVRTRNEPIKREQS